MIPRTSNMLCATCISIFQGPQLHGNHHSSVKNLERAANLGCKICISLCRLRSEHGPDEIGELATVPLLTFDYIHIYRPTPCWLIKISSSVTWLGDGHLIHFHLASPRPTPDWWSEFLYEAKKDLLAEPWHVRGDNFPSRVIPANTGDVEVAKLGLEWLNTCKNYHTTCEAIDETRNPECYPMRLLDIGNQESNTIRLIITEFERPPVGVDTPL